MTPYAFSILSLAILVAADPGAQWSEFTNNFATDLAPLITLFGEQVTKQFLSESTSFLDNIIFGVAPLGILTAVVSAIRVYGHASLKSFIGRAQEAHGVAEAELCSSTSEDVCELWSNGGICRVFGRPKILEFFYSQGEEFYPKFERTGGRESLQHPTCGIELPKLLFTAVHPKTSGGTIPSNWEETHSTLWSRSKRHRDAQKDTESGNTRGRFAPYPNLSLNVGMRTVRPWVLWIAVFFGVSLQLSFFAYATWATFFAQSLYENGDSPRLWSFWLAISGTTLLVIGMSLCARLIERKSCERNFRQVACNDPTAAKSAITTVRSKGRSTAAKDTSNDVSYKQSTIFWLQPGGQRIGDQLFNAFAYSEIKQEYVTSWRLDSVPSANNPDFIKHASVKLWIAITFSLFGFISQFVGLRGLHGSIALYQLASTLCMAIIRALLRSRRLQGDKNQLRKENRAVEGHELDWQALQLELSCMEADGMGQRVNESDSMSTNSSTNQEFHWYIHDYPYVIKDPDHNNQSSVKNDDVTILRLKNGIGCQLVGFRPSSGGFSQSKPDALDKRCADSAVDWIRHNEMNEDNPGRLHPNHAARIVHFRSRLAYLTTYPITPHGQEWDTDIRNMAESLQEALQDSANYIFSGVMKLSEGWKDASALVWSTTCQLSDPSMKSPHFPIHFLMYRNNKRWEISKYHLEAALGLWMWSLKLLPNDIQPFARKTMLAKEGLEKELESAIRLWVTQADMINDRIELLSPPSTNSSEHQWIPASISGESYYPTCLSVSVTTLLGPLELMEGNTEDKSHTRVLATQTRSSPLQMIAQDIFTIFISRIADIMEPLRDAIPRQNQLLTTQSLTNSEDRPYLGLMNAHIEIIIDRVVAVGIGSRQDVLMSIIPPLLSRCKLPPFDNLMDDLLFHSRSLRRDSRFQVGKDLLTGLLHSGPPKFHERVVRSLWELYRAAIRSPNQQDKDFGARGLVNFAKTCNGTGLSDLAKLAVGDYQQWGEMFIKLYNEKDHYKRKIDSETEFLDDLGRKEARPHGLTLTTEFDLSNAPLGLVLGILRWAILKNCPELVEDLWNINREVIHESYNDLGWSSIFWAIETGCDADTFLSLLESPTIRPDLYDKNGQTPLLVAAQKGHYEAVSLLLKRGVDKMAKDIDDRTALSLASENGHYEIVERLLLENAEVNAHDRLYGSALAAAAHRCHTKIVKFLVEEGKADVNKQLQSEYYNSALEAATKQRRTEIVKFLVQVGKADPNIPLANGTNGSVLEVAVYCGDSDIVKFLVLEGKADVNMQPEGGDYGSALAAAAYWGNTEIVKFLVQEGQADVNMVLQNGNHGSALAAAAYRENTEIVEFLVQEGQADVNMQSQSGHYGSPLAAAAYWGNTEIVKFLVQKGSADVNMNLQSGEYGSALAAAAYGRRIDIVRFLVLEESADVNLQLQKGDYGSALVAAVNGANISIVKFLVLEGKADANMNLLCGKYGSALAVAAYIGESRIVQFLVLEGNADVNMHLQRGIYGSALEAAVSGIDTDIMKYLVQEGRADVNMQLQRGNYGSALATAASKGRTDVVKYLVQEGQADVNMQIQRGNYGSALAAAVSGGGIDDVKYLVREGQADVNMVLQSGRYGSALAVAAHSGRPPMVQFLVQEGKADVNVNLQSGDFGSAFAAAAHGGSTNIVQFLIQEGKADANMRLQSGDYGSALTAATYRGESSVVQFLVKEGKVNVNQNLNSGRYGGPLATAAYFGWKQCVEILIEVGMNVTLKLENGPFESVLHAAMADISPKHLNRLFVDPRDEDARRKEKEETVALLLNHGAAR